VEARCFGGIVCAAANLSPGFVIASSLIVFFLAPQTFILARRKRLLLVAEFCMPVQDALDALLITNLGRLTSWLVFRVL